MNLFKDVCVRALACSRAHGHVFACTRVHIPVYGGPQRPEEALNSLSLELQVFVSHSLSALGTELLVFQKITGD